ncbi:hypothetical protein GC209_18200 [bacterium]|nr:hypothetical protein [bacterium]
MSTELLKDIAPGGLDDIQGNILRGYNRQRVRHMILQVADLQKARLFLKAAAGLPQGDPQGAPPGSSADPAGVPAISRASGWPKDDQGKAVKPPSLFNIGITCEGLRALRIPPAAIDTFPSEFRDGMTRRAGKLGDFGASGPQNWPRPFDRPQDVHLIASVYADDEANLDQVQAAIGASGQTGFRVLDVRDGAGLPEDKVYFGYRDSISQPNFGPEISSMRRVESQVRDPLGTVLLGYETWMEGLGFRVPEPLALGMNGSFSAFRVLSQDVKAFDAFLVTAAQSLIDARNATATAAKALAPTAAQGAAEVADGADTQADTANQMRLNAATLRVWDKWLGNLDPEGLQQVLCEFVAAQMCGRWRNGVPYDPKPDQNPYLQPDLPDAGPDRARLLNNFDYGPDARCPAGAHIRRGNPRGGPIVQREANYTRRIVRRGMPYMLQPDPLHPELSPECGLLGNFICANLASQFEAVMSDWINLGLQDPHITGDNDPLLGANSVETSRFVLSLPTTNKRGEPDVQSFPLHGLPRFIQSRGGAYTFLPSLTAIRYLANLTT